MKARLFLLFVPFACSLSAAELTLKDGRLLRAAEIVDVDEQRAVIKHADGIEGVALANIPPAALEDFRQAKDRQTRDAKAKTLWQDHQDKVNLAKAYQKASEVTAKSLKNKHGAATARFALGAYNVKLKDGTLVALPNQFVVARDGLRFLTPGDAKEQVHPWESLDLPYVARNEPEIDEARQRAMLRGEAKYFTITPSPDYLSEFLELPVNVAFNAKWEIRSQSTARYSISTTGFVSPSRVGGHIDLFATGFVTRSTVTTVVDKTRYPLATTIEGLFRMLGNDRVLDSSRLIQDLQASGAFFENLLIGMRNLQRLYPNDFELRATTSAVERLAYEKTGSIDAQRQLAKFVNYVRNRGSR